MGHIRTYSNQIGLQEDPSQCRENLLSALANCQAWDQPLDSFKETIEFNQMSKTVRFDCQCTICGARCPAGVVRDAPCEFSIEDL